MLPISLRRNSGKNTDTDEPENVPVNGKFHESSVAAQMDADSSSRPPLSAIRDPVQNPSKREQDPAFNNTKLYRTPPKVNATMKTPEKQGGLARNRYEWASDSKNEVKNRNMNMNIITNTRRSCGTVGRAVSSGYSECNLTPNTQCNSTQNTPTKSVNKSPIPGLSSRPPISGGVGNSGSFTALSREFQNTYPHVNNMEVPHFDLKEDPSFWMDHNVQVLIRIRPLNNMEVSAQGYNRCLKQDSAQCLTWVGQPETKFKFDHVACETIDQETLFRKVGLPMVENCLSGYNSCIFAYGGTGSGKTHTMLGEINEVEVKPSPYRGMTPRVFECLFARIEEKSRMNERLTYNCKCSFLEIYNEQITDLLDPSSTNLQLREDVKTGVYVENLTECEVHTVGDMLRLLSRGSANRRVAATNMNRESSRSHSVFTCVIESRWEKDSTSNHTFARLNLVDLAGSERQKTSGAEGERLKEAASINKSLSTLGHVIMVLVESAINARTQHVPYRDSRLTFLLQESLGGNSKTRIIANVSPSICSANETLNTLKFAQRAKRIQNNAVVNEEASGDIMALQQQIQLLKEAALARDNKENNSLRLELQKSQEELETCRNNLNSCLEKNEKLCREISDLNTLLQNTQEVIKDPISETHVNKLEEVMNLQLESDILKELETQQLVASIHEMEALGSTLEVQNDNIFNQDSQDDKLKKMKDSREFHASNEEEMDEVRKQVEAEVIVCLREEVCSLQEQLEEKEKQWELLSNEIHDVITTCHESHDDDVTVFEELQMITRSVFEKESRIRELKSCLEEMKIKGSEMEGMLMSLRWATLVMTEAHQEDCRRKDRVISQLIRENKETSVCAMGAFVVVNRFSEMKDGFLQVLKEKEGEIEELKRSYVVDIFEAKKRNNISGPKVNEEVTQEQENDINGHDNKTLKVSAKQLKSLESSLTGALRREQMSETFIKQLEENKMLTEEIQMLRAKVDRNPEVTRFAFRLLEQLTRFQYSYEQGEREMLLKEVYEMRNQLVLFLDENKQHDNIQKENAPDNKEIITLRLLFQLE